MRITDMRLDTGDLILFREECSWLDWVQMLFHVPVVHIGIVLRNPVWDGETHEGLYVAHTIWSSCADPQFYIDIEPLHLYIRKMDYTASVRLLHTSKIDAKEKMIHICDKLHHSNDPETIRVTSKRLLLYNSFNSPLIPVNWASAFIAAVYDVAGILGPFIIANRVVPDDFSSWYEYRLNFAELSTEIPIHFEQV